MFLNLVPVEMKKWKKYGRTMSLWQKLHSPPSLVYSSDLESMHFIFSPCSLESAATYYRWEGPPLPTQLQPSPHSAVHTMSHF